MLNYTSLFADLEELFAGAGRDPASFRRLAREVEQVQSNVDEYCAEVTRDYAARLEHRLLQPGARLSPEEVGLLRAYLGLAPPDPERDQRLVDDLGALEADLREVLSLRNRPLRLEHLDRLRALLDRMRGVMPRIVFALEALGRSRRFDEAVGAGEDERPLDRAWLVEAIRAARVGEEQESDSSGELPIIGS